MWLTADELVELTGYKQREPQKRALAQLGVAFKIRPADGFPLVLREHVVPYGEQSKREPKLRIPA